MALNNLQECGWKSSPSQQGIRKQGYTQGQADHTLVTKFSSKGKMIAPIAYGNDIIITSNDVV